MDEVWVPYRSIWGSLDVSDPITSHRTGITRYRLEIYPPGTNSIERRQLRRFRGWRVWAALTSFIACILIGGLWPGWTGPLLIVAIYAIVLGIGLHRTSRLRRSIRSVTAATVVVNGAPPVVEGNLRLLESCAVELEELDRHSLDGEVTPLRYELEWSRLYDELQPVAA